MYHSASRAKCHAGARPLERRVGRSRYAEQFPAAELPCMFAEHVPIVARGSVQPNEASIMATTFPAHFERQYQSHLKHLKLQGLRPKTIDAYARGMRRMG